MCPCLHVAKHPLTCFESWAFSDELHKLGRLINTVTSRKRKCVSKLIGFVLMAPVAILVDVDNGDILK